MNLYDLSSLAKNLPWNSQLTMMLPASSRTCDSDQIFLPALLWCSISSLRLLTSDLLRSQLLQYSTCPIANRSTFGLSNLLSIQTAQILVTHHWLTPRRKWGTRYLNTFTAPSELTNLTQISAPSGLFKMRLQPATMPPPTSVSINLRVELEYVEYYERNTFSPWHPISQSSGLEHLYRASSCGG